MKYKILFIFLCFSFTVHSQCFECNKNIGDWTDESAIDIEKTTDGIVYLVDSGGFVSSRINKYDFNCNLIWSKIFGYNYVSVKAATSDELGYIYIVIHNANSTNGGLGPFNISGFMMSPGLNFYKLNSSGTILWYKNIGPGVGYDMQNIFYYQNQLYVTGTFTGNLNFNNNLTFSLPFTNYSRAFIAKYDTDGNFINAINYGNGDDVFKYSEIDNQGNIYLTRSHYNAHNSNIDKFNSSLQLSWSKVLSSSTNSSNFGIYTPTGIRFNSENNKLYIWGKMSLTTNIMGNTYFVSNSNAIFQSVLTEFNTTNGNLENIKRFDNSSSYSNSYPSAVLYGRSAYMAEKNGYLYVLTSFRGTMIFPNGNATSTKYYNNTYDSEDLLLFKMKLSDFSSELLFQSNGVSNLISQITDLPGNIVFNGDDLYLTSTFGSTPMNINGSKINNNSGNNNPDAMLYKFNINSTSNSGEIKIDNTCLNELTNFSLNGNFDSIIWDFGDSASINNTSYVNNPQHQFSSSGNFHITATVICGTNTQTIEKDIVITNHPTINSLNTITNCETVSGTGICSQFDTSNINSLLIGNQHNVTIEYINSNGTVLPSPLPNPYTNTIAGKEIIIAKAFFVENPTCYSETNIEFYALPSPIKPSSTSPQTFCTLQNATLSDITIAGQNIKWYDTLTNGTLLPNTTSLQDGTTYYASQTINGCESERVSVLINIQNTPAPIGNTNQPFCSSQNATLENISITGVNIKWYDALTNGTVLSSTINLQNGLTYYASQTVNSCESPRLAVTVSIQNTPAVPTGDTNPKFCKSENATLNNITINGQNLKWYDSNTATTPLANTTLLQNNTTYYVSQTFGCESDRLAILVNVFDTPLPTANPSQTFCIDENATISTIKITGNNIKWYDSPTTTTISPTATTLENKTYYATQTNNNCESLRLAVNVKIQDTQAPIADVNQIFCVQQNATINNIQISGQNIKWYNTAGASLSESTRLENNSIYYASQTIANCESDRTPITIQILEATTSDCINFVDELPFPKFFTPNGDHYNDTWTIDFNYLAPNSGIKIFDRYGKLIKILNLNQTWDGTFNGYNSPSTDYWFVVTRLNGAEFKSHFSLKR